MCKIMKVRVSFIGIVEERRKEEDPKGPNSNTLYVHTQYWNMQYWIVFFASGVEAHRLTVVVLGVWSCTASAPRRAVAVHPLPSVHLLYVQYIQCQVCIFYMWSLQRGNPAAVQCPVQKLIELWFCVLIDTLLYSLHCVMQRLTVLCTAMHHLLTVWMCYEDFADFCGFVYIDTVLHSAFCNGDSSLCVVLWGLCSAHADSCGFVWRGKSWGRRAVEEDTAPLIHNTIIFFLHFCISSSVFLVVVLFRTVEEQYTDPVIHNTTQMGS